MPCRLFPLPFAAVACTVLVSTPCLADCADVLDSIDNNVAAFRDLHEDWTETLAGIELADEENRPDLEDTAFLQQEQLTGLAGKIVEHGQLLTETCIQDE